MIHTRTWRPTVKLDSLKNALRKAKPATIRGRPGAAPMFPFYPPNNPSPGDDINHHHRGGQFGRSLGDGGAQHSAIEFHGRVVVAVVVVVV